MAVTLGLHAARKYKQRRDELDPERKHDKDAARAHKDELKAEGREARYQDKAERAALRGRSRKAEKYEAKASKQQARAEHARNREQAAINAKAQCQQPVLPVNPAAAPNQQIPPPAGRYPPTSQPPMVYPGYRPQ